jgi:hypothetical protein
VGEIDNATWQALGLTLTVLGLVVSVLLWRRRGAASGLRAAAWSLLPLAAGLTGTLRLLWEIADSVTSWAARLVFSPAVWLGIVLAVVSVVLFVVSGILRRRTPSRRAAPAAVPAGGKGAPAVTGGDDDMAEIEALLKKHGIA